MDEGQKKTRRLTCAVLGDEVLVGRQENGHRSLTLLEEEAASGDKRLTVSNGYLGGQQACQVDLRQDLLAVTVPV